MTTSVAHPGMTARIEVVIKRRPVKDSTEYILEINKRDSIYSRMYHLQAFKTLTPLEVEALRNGEGIFFDRENVFTSSAGRFYSRIRHNGELSEVAEFAHTCARLCS
jgi:hypothetical protein